MAFVTAQQQANANAMNAMLQASATFAQFVATVCQLAVNSPDARLGGLGIAAFGEQNGVTQAAWRAVFPGAPYPTTDPNANPFAKWGVVLNAGNQQDGLAAGLAPGCIPYTIVPDVRLANILAAIFAPILNIVAPGSGTAVQGAANAANGPDTTYVPPSTIATLTGGGGLTSMLLFVGAAVLLGVLVERG